MLEGRNSSEENEKKTEEETKGCVLRAEENKNKNYVKMMLNGQKNQTLLR